MDGVLTDFCKSAYAVYPRFDLMHGLYSDEIKCQEKRDIRKDFSKTIRETPNFWLNMDWLSAGISLVNHVTNNYSHVGIITAPMSEDPDCERQKRLWVNQHLGFFIKQEHMFVGDDKYKYMNSLPGKHQILIDDRKKNIDLWNANGGIGILHSCESLDQTLSILTKYI